MSKPIKQEILFVESYLSDFKYTIDKMQKEFSILSINHFYQPESVLEYIAKHKNPKKIKMVCMNTYFFNEEADVKHDFFKGLTAYKDIKELLPDDCPVWIHTAMNILNTPEIAEFLKYKMSPKDNITNLLYSLSSENFVEMVKQKLYPEVLYEAMEDI